MSITDLTLSRIRKTLSAHYKENSSTELLQVLSNLVQLPEEGTVLPDAWPKPESESLICLVGT